MPGWIIGGILMWIAIVAQPVIACFTFKQKVKKLTKDEHENEERKEK